MQNNHRFFGTGYQNHGTSNFVPPYNPFSIPCQHQCCPSPYPEVIGEGDVSSLVLPDGSIQLYFLPIAKWDNYQSYNNCSPCSANKVWFVRRVTNPVPHPICNVQPVLCGAQCPSYFSNNFSIPINQSPMQQSTFPWDPPTPSFKIKASTENRSAETECTPTNRPCQDPDREENPNHDCECAKQMIIEENKRRKKAESQEKKYRKQQKRENKRRKSRNKKCNKRKKKDDYSSSSCSYSSTGHSCSDMSIDGSSSCQSFTSASQSSIGGGRSGKTDHQKKTKNDKKAEKQRPSRDRPSDCTCESCMSITNKDGKSRKKTNKDKKASKQRSYKDSSCEVCESCMSIDGMSKDGKSRNKTKKASSKQRSYKDSTCGVCDSCKAQDKQKESKRKDDEAKKESDHSELDCGDCYCESHSKNDTVAIRNKEKGVVIRDDSPDAVNCKCQTEEQSNTKNVVAPSDNETDGRFQHTCPCDDILRPVSDAIMGEMEMWLSKLAEDFIPGPCGVRVTEID